MMKNIMIGIFLFSMLFSFGSSKVIAQTATTTVTVTFTVEQGHENKVYFTDVEEGMTKVLIPAWNEKAQVYVDVINRNVEPILLKRNSGDEKEDGRFDLNFKELLKTAVEDLEVRYTVVIAP